MSSTANSARPAITPRIMVLTLLAVIAFAGNSTLNRLGVVEGGIDAPSYSTIRVLSSALFLLALLYVRDKGRPQFYFSPLGISSFAVYIVGLAYAYLSLETGIGALLLFGAVQLTMIGWGWHKGERFTPLSWLGIVVAIIGLIYLLAPGLLQGQTIAVDPKGAAAMLIGGMAWGVYSLTGRGKVDPLVATTWNITLSLPPILVLSLLTLSSANVTWAGAIYAIASGVITSAVGYIIWFAALKALSATQASIVQLGAPVFAVLMGAAFVAEPITLRVVLASVLTLGGVALIISQRHRGAT